MFSSRKATTTTAGLTFERRLLSDSILSFWKQFAHHWGAISLEESHIISSVWHCALGKTDSHRVPAVCGRNCKAKFPAASSSEVWMPLLHLVPFSVIKFQWSARNRVFRASEKAACCLPPLSEIEHNLICPWSKYWSQSVAGLPRFSSVALRQTFFCCGF